MKKYILFLVFLFLNLQLLFGYSEDDWSIIRKYAPFFYQHVNEKNVYDQITRLDFDGNFDAGDNTKNALTTPLPAYVYAEILAETKDAYYITYNVYHAMDWQSGIMGKMPGQVHDNDFEGAIVAIDKKHEMVIAVESRWHTFITKKMYFEVSADSGMHFSRIYTIDSKPVMFVEAEGHGVTVASEPMFGEFQKEFNGIRYYYGAKAEIPDKDAETQEVSYDLLPMSDLYEQTKEPYGKGHMFATETIELFGLTLPRFFQGGGNFNTDKDSFLTRCAKPKMPWYWLASPFLKDDSAGYWYFDPADTFKKDFGWLRSTDYLTNNLINFFRKPPEDQKEKTEFYNKFLGR